MKMAFFGNACRNNRHNRVKTGILEMMPEKRTSPRVQYIDNINNWSSASMEENIRMADDRIAWHKRSCASGAANVRTCVDYFTYLHELVREWSEMKLMIKHSDMRWEVQGKEDIMHITDFRGWLRS